MHYNFMEGCKASSYKHKSNVTTAGQQYRLEDPQRLDRNTMQYDFTWPGKTITNVPPIRLGNEIQ